MLSELQEALTRLARDGRIAASTWPANEDPQRYGLRAVGDRIEPVGRFDPLVPERIRATLTHRATVWLQRLEVHPVIGSTNTELMGRAQRGSVDGTVCLAELQVEGRGRRGRNWASPFAANLAVSIGMNLDRRPTELGGVSLVVGLAVLDALDQLEVSGAALKWPNDVLLGGAKLGGILIEMVQGHGTELVIGIGMNVAIPESLRDELPYDVADLSRVSAPPARSVLAGKVISTVVEFVGEFEHLGFEPFRAPFDARHHYQGRECEVVQGDRRTPGTVTGVNERAELVMRTAAGERSFHAGEVSLR